jgi:hypothetical protein
LFRWWKVRPRDASQKENKGAACKEGQSSAFEETAGLLETMIREVRFDRALK